MSQHLPLLFLVHCTARQWQVLQANHQRTGNGIGENLGHCFSVIECQWLLLLQHAFYFQFDSDLVFYTLTVLSRIFQFSPRGISILVILTHVLDLVASPNIFAKFNRILHCFDIFLHLPLDYIRHTSEYTGPGAEVPFNHLLSF